MKTAPMTLHVTLMATDDVQNLEIHKGTAILGVEAECEVSLDAIRRADDIDDRVRIKVSSVTGMRCTLQMRRSHFNSLLKGLSGATEYTGLVMNPVKEGPQWQK